MEIQKRIQIVNDKTCKEYNISVPKEEIENVDEILISKSNKYYDYIIDNISDDEEVVYKFPRRYSDKIIFSVYTKKKKIIILENKIAEVLKLDKHQIDINEDFMCSLMFPNFKYNEETLIKMKNLLDAETFEVYFDGHMETDYVFFKLRKEAYSQRVYNLYKEWTGINDILEKLRVLGVKENSDIYKLLQECKKNAWEKYSNAYDANEKIYSYITDV